MNANLNLNIPLPAQIACVKREIQQRKWVYKRRVESKKMSQEKADYEMQVMEAVLQTLTRLYENSGNTVPLVPF